MKIKDIAPKLYSLERQNHALELFLEQIAHSDGDISVCTQERYTNSAGGESAVFFPIPVDDVHVLVTTTITRNKLRIEQLQKVVDVAEAAMRDFDTTQ